MIILYINDVPIGCLTSTGLSEAISFIKTCKTTQNGAGTSIGRQHSYSIPFEAVYSIDGAIVTYDDLREYGVNRELVEWALEDGDNLINEAGQAYLENIEMTASSTDFIKFTGTLTGYGAIVSSPITYNVWYQDVDTPVDEGGNYVLVN
jgi:hypothetical protein